MRGVQFVTAVGMVSEVSDLSRFEHPHQRMAWLGVTPSEHSSGGERRQGSMTKTGNSVPAHLDRVLIPRYRAPEAAVSASGSGVGLAMARRFAHAMCGELELENPRSGGLQVRLTLPLAAV